MGIGIGILLIAVGAILTFAVHATVSGLDIRTVGVILMAVGALGLLLDLVILMPRRRHVTREQVYSAGAPAVPPPGSATGSAVTRDSVDGSY